MSFLKRLFGITGDRQDNQTAMPGRSQTDRDASLDAAVAQYFELAGEISRLKSQGNYPAALEAVRASLPLLPKFVLATKRDVGRFDIASSEAVHTGARLMAVMEDSAGIEALRSVLAGTPELTQWLDVAREAETDVDLVGRIFAAVLANEGVLQNELKEIVGEDDGRRIATLVAAMERGGRLARIPKSGTNALYCPGSKAFEAAKTKTTGGPTSVPNESLSRPRRRRSAAHAPLLDLEAVPYVRLPMAPPLWDAEAANDIADEGVGDATSYFSVDGDGWTIASDERLPRADRPDPSFRDVFPSAATTYWLDPKGKREGYESAASVLQATDRNGQLIAERALGHDVYRSDVNPGGSGIIFLSRTGVVHAYSATLDDIILDQVGQLPEYEAQAERLAISRDDLRLHVRCVALSSDMQSYLVTVVDEAWLVSVSSGNVIWGLRTPMQDGWAHRAEPRGARTGTSAEVEAALRLMELRLPVTNEDLTRQYRVLASRWHPDRNHGDPSATERFQDLRAATELLTGIDLSGLSGSAGSGAIYEKVLGQSKVSVPVPGAGSTEFTLTMSMSMDEKGACDWIYAANLGHDGRAFIACYSGKVIVVSPSGTPEFVYDIGAVPRHIEDVGDRLYILTDTRLYILTGDRLDALIDVYDRGELLLTETGFALQDAKQLTWYSELGERIGSIRSKAPIRRAFSTSDGLVVETRTRRLVVAGAPSWWN